MLPPRPTGPRGPLPQRELLKRYSTLVLLSAAARVFGFAAVVLMARGYGVEVFGEISFAQATVGYGFTFAVFGLGIWGVRAAVRDPDEVGRTAATVIAIRLVLAVIAFLALLALLLLPAFRDVAGLVVLFALTLFTGALSVQWVAQALQRTDVLGLVGLAIQALFLGQVWLALELGVGKLAVPVALVTSELVVHLALLAWMRARVMPLGRPYDLEGCLRVVKESAPLAGSQMLRALALGSDIVLLGLLLTMEQVGAYGAAYKIFVLGFTLVSLYVMVVLPHLVHHGEVSVRQLAAEVGSLLRKLMLLAVPAALAGMSLAPWVVRRLFGEEFAGGVDPMRILIVAVVASLVASHYRPAVLAMGEHTRDLRNMAISGVVHVGGKLVLIPLLGLTGAALGTLTGEIALAAASWLTLRGLEADEADRKLDSEALEEAGAAAGPPGAELE